VANIANAAAATGPAAAPAPGVPAPAAGPVPGGAVAAAQELGGQVFGGIIDIVSLDVTPKMDGKVKIDFFGNDRKIPRNQYASLSWTTTPEMALSKLNAVAGFTNDQMYRVGSFSLKCRLYWVPGKLNKAGVPYKDVDHFEPA
jgi:hypothetical protein